MIHTFRKLSKISTTNVLHTTPTRTTIRNRKSAWSTTSSIVVYLLPYTTTSTTTFASIADPSSISVQQQQQQKLQQNFFSDRLLQPNNCTYRNNTAFVPTTIRRCYTSIFKKPTALSKIQTMSLTTMNGGSSTNHTTTTTATAEKYELPSTMTGMPIASLVEPGQCQFTTEWTAVPLLQKYRVSSTTMVLRFGVPDTSKSLQLSTCACILAHTKMNDEDVVRPYTPISTNADIGYFDLLVKHYGPDAKMSRYMHDIIQIGDTLDFKHIEFNVKIQAPSFTNKEHIYMIVGGTGITPMIQALHAILGSNDTTTKAKVTMIYGSKYANDILGYEILDQWSKMYPDRFQVVHVLSNEPNDSTWTGLRGFINQQILQQYIQQTPTTVDSDSGEPPFLIFVCGPPPMYNVLCGPREEKNVTGILGTMGYQSQHVYKF